MKVPFTEFGTKLLMNAAHSDRSDLEGCVILRKTKEKRRLKELRLYLSANDTLVLTVYNCEILRCRKM